MAVGDTQEVLQKAELQKLILISEKNIFRGLLLLCYPDISDHLTCSLHFCFDNFLAAFSKRTMINIQVQVLKWPHGFSPNFASNIK